LDSRDKPLQSMTKTSSTAKPDLILALDLPDQQQALQRLQLLAGKLHWVKIGLEMFCRLGPDWVHQVADLGYKIFLDLKLHDIPNTVAGAVRSLQNLPIQLLTIHASGGREMIEAAVQASAQRSQPLNILAVTVLTSLSQESFPEIGWSGSSSEQVLRLAQTAVAAGAPGLVCSGHELSLLRKELPQHIQLVIPGIRPAGSDLNEQKRVFTPADAVRAGASALVVGRPILAAQDPVLALEQILQEIDNAVASK
jgi:orotidine-5'-phosphate decarboxylase